MSRSRTGGRRTAWDFGGRDRAGSPRRTPIIDLETGEEFDPESAPSDRPRHLELLHGDPRLPRLTFTVLAPGTRGAPASEPAGRGDPDDPSVRAEEGAEWRRHEWSAADPVPERAAVIGRIRRTFARERFPLDLEEVQSVFRESASPFEILWRRGVFISNGRSTLVMQAAFVDLWNYTERPELGERSPVEELRRRILARGAPPSRADRDASLVCVSAHNLDCVDGAGRAGAGMGSGGA